MKYKVNYNQDWDGEGYHTTQNINIVCTPKELNNFNTQTGVNLQTGKQRIKLTPLKHLKDTVFADNPRVKDDRNTFIDVKLIDEPDTPLHESRNLKETVLRALMETLESGEIDPWLKQQEMDKDWKAESKRIAKEQAYNNSYYPQSNRNIPDENLNVVDNNGRFAMDSMSDKPYKREFGRTTMSTPNQSIQSKLTYQESKERIRQIAEDVCEELLTDHTEYLDGKSLTLTSRGGVFTAKVTYVDHTDPKGVKLYAEVGHTPVVITLSDEEYYNLVTGDHGTANAKFQAENGTLPPTDCTLRVD